jgi:putative component of membrane protein insertase Oxa1/YidC/SpoIIIJ protein YidD
MKKILLITVFLSVCLQAQTDWERWEKVDFVSQFQNLGKGENETLQKSSFLSVLKDSYSFLISDLDGDNCPFYPTCSNFFVHAVHETNILKGTLMFADRFTRDSNLFKSKLHYAYHISGKLYDPIDNYLLADSSIIFHSRDKIVK